MNISIPQDNLLQMLLSLNVRKRKWLADKLMASVKMEKHISPSADPYFDNPDNIKDILQAEEDIRSGKGKVMTIDEIKAELCV
ncbi:MAG: hypothetical protein HUK06_07015 [Bacteroidaceae bacterium]|nr:hypothetical protein [Bacteroidaceae bacterium]